MELELSSIKKGTFTTLPVGQCVVVRVVDAAALHHQEEPVVALLQNLDGLFSHVPEGKVGEYLRYSIERYRRYSPFLYLICI